ncbi:MAG TPA: hypothetical protein VFO62_00950 [Candidatus Binatia bacterium]|nr:hypothetical protein [Candidatus Binatia bacterium]
MPSPAGGVDFWLAWIQRESGGNPCSYTSLRESGLFQLMPPDNTGRGGTTEQLLRAACVAGSQSLSRSLNENDVREQMVSFQRYLAYITQRTRDKLAQVGASWSESSPDFWQLVKFQHTLPAPTVPWLQAATAALGRPPANWAELAPYASAAGVPAKWVENARWVGSYGTGGQIPVVIAALAVGSAVMYYLWRKRRR